MPGRIRRWSAYRRLEPVKAVQTVGLEIFQPFGVGR